MKLFSYGSNIDWGYAQGFVIAENKTRALEMIKEQEKEYLHHKRKIYIEEFPLDKEHIESMTYSD